MSSSRSNGRNPNPDGSNVKPQNSKRPPDSDFCQQRLVTRPANFTSFHLAIIIVIIGIVFLPVGTKLLSLSNQIYEQKHTYDGGSSSECSISEANEGTTCQVTFTFDSTVSGPIFLYYQLENFYQNHRRYYQSRSIGQLQGQVLEESGVSLDCNPLYMNGTILLNPCGLIANSYFNDVFQLDSNASQPSSLYLDESDIAIASDRHSLYKQVQGFEYYPITDLSTTCTDVGLLDGCKYYLDVATNTSYLFYYPNDDTVQYLYESYPYQISPLVGVTDQHFMVWMKTEALPTFRKLYGKIDSGFNAGDKLVINVTANFEVDSFEGKKSLVISNLGQFGGENPFPGQVFITIGAFSLVFGLFLFAKEFYF